MDFTFMTPTSRGKGKAAFQVSVTQGHNGYLSSFLREFESHWSAISRNSRGSIHTPRMPRHQTRPFQPPPLGPTPPAGVSPHTDLNEHGVVEIEETRGNIGLGLTVNFISKNLKTKTFVSSRSSHVDDEHKFCVICQVEFENEEKIGVLKCCHEYHEECIKKWLIRRNRCPICKLIALVLD
ncbi:hypothetical protein L2E82_37516 [Cichorium intybus]|uniref:Uncharacterized protein n=1 Tax=Cichorium intybus TaxID=13427 RepID=A0ACB9AG47_CICIN|nr:hypothetical protein L2E82_37516 [Cichorium intybus]